MGQYCFARWRLSSVVWRRLSLSVTLPAGGPAAGRAGCRAADTARRASGVTSRLQDTMLIMLYKASDSAAGQW